MATNPSLEDSRLAIAERVIAADRNRGNFTLRDQMQLIAESNSARGRLGSGMYAEEQKKACGEELGRRAKTAWEVYRQVATSTGAESALSTAISIKARLREIVERDRIDLTRELHGRLGVSWHSLGLDDLTRFADQVLSELEPQVDLFFLTRTTRTSVPSVANLPTDVAATAAQSWPLLHQEVVTVSRSRFEAGHYADSVEAALKAMNVRVKAIVLARIGRELDGAPLMNTAFSPNAPIIKLGDSSETGRSIQQGYLLLFSGAMTAIRNPKAHANVEITAERALHLIYFASFLMSMLDEAIN